jgi:hypothetical protein
MTTWTSDELARIPSAWYRGPARHQGHIHAGDVDKDVAFVDVGNEIKRPGRRRLPHQIPPLRRSHHRHHHQPLGPTTKFVPR